MEELQLYGIRVINRAHWVFFASMGIFASTLFFDIPSLAMLSRIFLVSTLFFLGLFLYWWKGSVVAWCAGLIPVIFAVNSSEANQGNHWQYFALVFSLSSLYLWGFKSYLTTLLCEGDFV